MTGKRFDWRMAALNAAPLLLFAAVLIGFGSLSPKFLTADNLMNILVQCASTALVAIGMTFVLLTAGVDLSVGAIMFVAAAAAGKLALQGWGLAPCLLVLVAVGAAFGAVNAACITRFRIIPFVVTLATLNFGRGVALWITETRAMNLPDAYLELGALRVLGIPFPVVLLGCVLAAAHVVLTCTPFGRQLYAVGQNPAAARKAGVRTGRLLAAVYVISGVCAALGAILSLTQLGAVGPKFGELKEFGAIAAAVLGGTSLFGGRGKVFPGTLLGAVLIQSVENGLVIINADPYLYRLITSAIIFVAVLTDSIRSRVLTRLLRRKIRREPGDAVAAEPV